MTIDPSSPGEYASAGWGSDFPRFRQTAAGIVRDALKRFVPDASPEQIRAWEQSIPVLQNEVGELLNIVSLARGYGAVLEYELPLEARRADGVFLVAGSVVVLELKGKSQPTQADLDQAAAYARDLRAYHRECQERPVHAVLVPMGSKREPESVAGVWVTGPGELDRLMIELTRGVAASVPDLNAFLDAAAYRPLPTLVQAARELFESKSIRPMWQSFAVTDRAVDRIAAIAMDAALTKTRHLVLLTGVPGSGKTLVGMRAVHGKHLDELAVPRNGEASSVPALFLSGNGPLVEVLQHVLKTAGGGGKTFVRHVQKYLDAYVEIPGSSRKRKTPPEHLLVFDEAQRAFSADMVAEKHPKWPVGVARSEPEHFVDVCERMPEWSVLVGLIGTGQEINRGEESGIRAWRDALEKSQVRDQWVVHAPVDVQEFFDGSPLKSVWEPDMNLDTSLRFHLATDLHRFVAEFLGTNGRADGASLVAERVLRPAGHESDGLRLWATRNLLKAKRYLWDRFEGQPDARFGLLASSRDKLLERFGVPNSYAATRAMNLGAWYAEGEESGRSCRHLSSCVTEFGAQGLELDMALLCWGGDFRRVGDQWSTEDARKIKVGAVAVRDPYQLRLNAYRVLMTRGREGTIVFVPPDATMDETWGHLLASGFGELERHL
jgi:hypothetical protein